MRALTQRQEEVLSFIRGHMRINSASPTYAEIRKYFGWRSQNAAATHVEALEKKGVLSLRRNVSRGIFAVRKNGKVHVCKKCGGYMKDSQAMESTVIGVPDFPDGQVVTMSFGGPGKLVDCLKCKDCGWSVTV